jgi:hypothetical protein
VDGVSGEVTGPVRELADALGKKLGLPVKITPLNGVPAVLDSVKTNQADIGFVAADPSRAGEVDFSQTYLLGWASCIVPVLPRCTASKSWIVPEFESPGLPAIRLAFFSRAT